MQVVNVVVVVVVEVGSYYNNNSSIGYIELIAFHILIICNNLGTLTEENHIFQYLYFICF